MISKDYFSDVNIQADTYTSRHRADALMHNIAKNFTPEFEKNTNLYDIAIIGVPEDRNSSNKGAALAPDAVRAELYALYKPFDTLRIIDLGNLKQGKTVKDSYFSVRDTVSYLLQNNIIPVIIGGTQDLSFPVAQAYEKRRRLYNIVTADARLDLNNPEENVLSESFVSQIVTSKSKYLFNLTNIGYQSYYTPNMDKTVMFDLYFDAVRLGEARADMRITEPYLRDADFFSFDISSVRMTDAPAHNQASVHGFYGEEACQLAKYAGMSDRLSSFGLFEMNPEFDERGRTAQLSAQIIWHFIQGVYMRQKDYPAVKMKGYKQYIVKSEILGEDIIFYQSPRTMRWWVQVPYVVKSQKKMMLVSCHEETFNQASLNEIPDLWWRYFRKLN